MKYWDGSKKTHLGPSFSMEKLEALKLSPDIIQSLLNYTASKPGPFRKLSLETEFFMAFMKQRLGLLKQDLTFKFSISAGNVIFILLALQSSLKLLKLMIKPWWTGDLKPKPTLLYNNVH